MGKLNLHQLSALVLDEVDVLFLDDTFLLQPIGEATAPSTQFVFVTATIPTSVFAQIKQEFPDLRRIMGPGLHRIAPGVEEVLVDCSGPKDEAKNEFTAFERKRKALAGQLDKVVVPRTLIFCNSIENCRRVENALRRLDRGRKKFQVLPYHSGIDNERRREIFNAFTRENFLVPMVGHTLRPPSQPRDGRVCVCMCVLYESGVGVDRPGVAWCGLRPGGGRACHLV